MKLNVDIKQKTILSVSGTSFLCFLSADSYR